MNQPSSSNNRDEYRPPQPAKRRACGSIRTVACILLGAIVLLGTLAFVGQLLLKEDAQPNVKGPLFTDVDPDQGDPQQKRGSFTDRLFEKSDKEPDHELDPALEVARLGLEKLRADVSDYKALMVKQERLNKELLDEEFMQVKVRHGNADQDVNKAFYVRHVKPASMAGQEAIWVENQNDGKLIGHGSGLQKLITVNLKPDSWLAMRGNRYPITELGIETLLIRMIEKGEKSRKHEAACQVDYSRDLKINGNPATKITITHPEKHRDLEFHVAKIYIDDKLQLPVGYEGYTWPEKEGGEPLLIERYFYQDLEINPGLTELDFDPQNPEYEY